MVVTAEQHSDEVAGLGIPQADCPVGGPAGQHLSVRRESEAADRIRMTPQNPEHPAGVDLPGPNRVVHAAARSEEHTFELQSQFHLVCRLLLEKKKQPNYCIAAPEIIREQNSLQDTQK